MLNLNIHTGSPATRGRGLGEGTGSRGTSVQGRRSGEIMGIEEEDEDEIEEVEEFSPVIGSAVEVIEETTAGAQTPLESDQKAGLEKSEGEALPPTVPEKEDIPTPLEKKITV